MATGKEGQRSLESSNAAAHCVRSSDLKRPSRPTLSRGSLAVLERLGLVAWFAALAVSQLNRL